MGSLLTISLLILSFSIRSFSFFCSLSVLAWYVATALVTFCIFAVMERWYSLKSLACCRMLLRYSYKCNKRTGGSVTNDVFCHLWIRSHLQHYFEHIFVKQSHDWTLKEQARTVSYLMFLSPLAFLLDLLLFLQFLSDASFTQGLSLAALVGLAVQCGLQGRIAPHAHYDFLPELCWHGHGSKTTQIRQDLAELNNHLSEHYAL